ncbi:flagellin [Hydrogenophaga bisanensis]|uniref:Flagellin n=1 Tax=Hydrogenophaga bisanensis TaxID=439611 RepID=A0ABW2RE68_9BURK
MSTINTNVMSINAQRNLSASTGSLATSMQRLSSGLRVNSAKDDAAGLAISERMNSQVKGLNVAIRNANDGISLAQTAEGAMAEIGNNLQRIRELAVQSSNATNSATDREALQKEVSQLQAEIQRVATQTEFNGTKLLDGSFTGKAFQVGANAGQLITVDAVTNAQTDSLGGSLFAERTFTATVTTSDTNTDGAFDFGAVNISAFTITNPSNGELVSFDAISIAAETAGTGTGDAAAAELRGQNTVGAALVSAINAKSGEAGVIASLDETTGEVTIQSLISGEVGDTLTTTLSGADTAVALAAGDEVFVSSVDISTFAGAQQAIGIMDSALTTINSARADMGAIQNRFGSVIQNLQTSSENLSAARGRIVDADFAKETANLSRAQILQQAGTAMVAQANQLPQGVLSLLR